MAAAPCPSSMTTQGTHGEAVPLWGQPSRRCRASPAKRSRIVRLDSTAAIWRRGSESERTCSRRRANLDQSAKQREAEELKTDPATVY